MNSDQLIKSLNLEPHPEGGYFKETYRSNFEVTNLESKLRSAITSIYYLLEKGNFSALHRIKSDEIWYYHAGQTLELVAIDLDGSLHTWMLGADVEKGQVLQVVMEAGWIFGARCVSGYSLVGCAVAPGFHFVDFEILSREKLLSDFPQHNQLIENYTR